ncbi:MAG: hypothetical protein AAGC46_18980, partial [Solirubrobacteraceae bacterium]|nr:hypothetical protein [Patulibacter sp.]
AAGAATAPVITPSQLDARRAVGGTWFHPPVAGEARPAAASVGDARAAAAESSDPAGSTAAARVAEGDDPVDANARRGGRALRLPPVGLAAGVALLLLAAVWSSAQWIADRDVQSAALIGYDQPKRALDRANVAESLMPFGEQGEMLLGALAVARNDFPAAALAYGRAHDRNPRAARPRMWLGVMASASGDQAQALRWLRAAHRVAPRDALVSLLLSQVQAGTRVSPRGVASQLVQISVGLTKDPDPVEPTTPTTPAATVPAPGQQMPSSPTENGAAPAPAGG